MIRKVWNQRYNIHRTEIVGIICTGIGCWILQHCIILNIIKAGVLCFSSFMQIHKEGSPMRDIQERSTLVDLSAQTKRYHKWRLLMVIQRFLFEICVYFPRCLRTSLIDIEYQNRNTMYLISCLKLLVIVPILPLAYTSPFNRYNTSTADKSASWKKASEDNLKFF